MHAPATQRIRPALEPAARERLVGALVASLGAEAVLADDLSRLAYDVDGFTIAKYPPDVVLLPKTTEDVSAALRIAHEHGVPVTARGAGTGLAGGALAEEGGILLVTSRMDRILEVDAANRFAVVQPGVVNVHLSERVQADGLFYAPDPSSQMASTLGGNAATNAGGPHCLKYGQTHQHVRGMTLVLADGSVVVTGGRALDLPGPNVTGLMVGSEGTFAVVTELVVTLTPRAETVRTLLVVFDDVRDAGRAVTSIVAQGITPAALEMIDHLTIVAVEPYVKLGLPLDAGAVLLAELDGPRAGMDRRTAQVRELCLAAGARSVREAKDDAERLLLWKARKGAFGAMGRIASGFYILDGVVPRTKLPEALDAIARVGAKHALRIANVFHAGDGNLHPNVIYDVDDPDSVARAWKASEEILEACVALGGSLSGEHGIGNEKRDFMGLSFSADDLAAMDAVRRAFDPGGLLNPHKMLPRRPACGEGLSRIVRRAPALAVDGDGPWI